MGSGITCSRLELCQECVPLNIREVATYPDSLSLVVPGVDQDDVNEKSYDPWKPGDAVDTEDDDDIFALGEKLEEALDSHKLGQPRLAEFWL